MMVKTCSCEWPLRCRQFEKGAVKNIKYACAITHSFNGANPLKSCEAREKMDKNRQTEESRESLEEDKKDESERETSQSEMPQELADDEENLDQMLEEHMRDLCVLRKTIPAKCAALLNEELELGTPLWATAVSSVAEPSNVDSEQFKVSFEEFDRCCQQYKECEEESSFPQEFDDLAQQCRNLIQLKKVQSGMGLNDTQELLYSNKRKREAENSALPEEKPLTRPGFEDLPSLSSPISNKDTSMKKASSSKIPRRKKGQMTPVTPISRASSLRKKLLKKSAGKT